MTINQKALVQTVAIIVGIVGGAALASYLLSLISPAAPAIASCAMLLGVFAYMTYGLVKNRLEAEQKG
jgi:hypothetical protein